MAVGVLMERRNLDRQGALDVLRSYARSHRRRVYDASEELLKSLEFLNLDSRTSASKTEPGKQAA